MQIRSRLTLQFTLLVSSILLVALFSIYFFSQKSTEDEFYNRLKEKAVTSAILLLKVEQVDSTLLKTIDLSKHDVLFRENISILDEQNKEITQIMIPYNLGCLHHNFRKSSQKVISDFHKENLILLV